MVRLAAGEEALPPGLKVTTFARVQYSIRIFARYDHEVETLVILANDNPTWRPRAYRYGRWYSRTGLETEPVKLLDYANQVEALERDPNPFALIVLAHLKTLETRDQPDARRGWKVRVIKGLYERGLKAEDVRELFRIIDWLMNLPKPLEKLFWDEIEQLQEEKRMPYIPHIQRIWREEGLHEGLLKGIELGLKLRFGAAGLELLPEIRQLEEHEKLEAVLEAIETAGNPDELRRAWAPKRRSRKRS
jgi:hypothetical protein